MGANGPELGAAYALAFSLLLLAMLGARWGRAALQRPASLAAPAVLFFGVIAAALFSLFARVSPTNDPFWTAVGAAPSTSINHQATVLQGLDLAALGAVFVMGFAIGRDRARTWFLLRSLVIASVPYDILCLGLHVLSPQTLFGYAISTGPDRLVGTFGSANIAGALFGLLILCATATLLQHWREARRRSDLPTRQLESFLRRAPLEMAAVLLSAACLVTTASRGALAATVASLLVLLLWEAFANGLSNRRWMAPAGVLLGLAVVIGVGGDLVAQRYLVTTQDVAVRVAIFQSHWRAFGFSNWLGSGLGSFPALNALLMNRSNVEDLLTIGAAHNIYLQWLEQAGVIGSLLMWGCIAWLVAGAWLALARKPRLGVVMRLAVAASLLLASHGLTDFALEVPAVTALWALLLGLAWGRGV